jgi:hypothetical protein
MEKHFNIVFDTRLRRAHLNQTMGGIIIGFAHLWNAHSV